MDAIAGRKGRGRRSLLEGTLRLTYTISRSGGST
jgi:hypothetical protein